MAMERLSAEGGVRWDEIYLGGQLPVEKQGVHLFYGRLTQWIKKWPEDTWFERVDLETARRWRWKASGGLFVQFQLWYTYHTCGPFTVSGDVSNSAAGTVTLGLHRASDGQLLKSTTRSGNGAYSFNWWDNTENVFVEATEDATHIGRSVDGLATGSA
jgi:hypothetical protein